jgi:hypothetical protein
LGAIFIVGAFALAWLNRTPESTDIVEKARLERLQEAEESNWWVERIEEPEPTMEQLETPESEEDSDLPVGMNR